MKAKITTAGLSCTDPLQEKQCEKSNNPLAYKLTWKVGAIVDHPAAFRLVQAGLAEPADEECATRAGVKHESPADR